MREIIFKGKRIDTGNWVYGYLLYVDGKPFIFELGTHINHSAHFGENGGFGILGSGDIPNIVGFEGNKTSRGWLCEIKPETISQYIGINDKTGNKIFENYILKGKFGTGIGGKSTKYKEFNFSISFHEHSQSFGLDMPKGYGQYRFHPYLTECIIIGNIFDHSELLQSL